MSESIYLRSNDLNLFFSFVSLTVGASLFLRRQGTSKKKSQEAILRQRAKKRESHLEKLQKQGKYNPDKPTKPDPERWIPKNQRSYNRRGRKGRSKFLGAQGGGTGFGADKEAAKLDAYARAIAKAEGKDLSGGQPSTAHMSVSSSGRRRR
jgi:signal recognition particle subunit SRP72